MNTHMEAERIKVRQVRDNEGPDASRYDSEADPKLLQARHLLNSLIANPPKGSIPMLIDEPLAQAMLERNSVNRDIRKRLIIKYAGALKRDEWDHNGNSLKFSACGQMNDGQHRCLAVIRSGVAMLTDVRFGLDRKTIVTLDTGTARTAGDALKIAGFKSPSGVAAIARLLWRYRQPNRMSKQGPTHKQIKQIVADEPRLIDAARASDRYRGDYLLPKSVIGFVWLLATGYNEHVANEFFRRVTTGVGIVRQNEAAARMRQSALNNTRAKGKWSSDYAAALLIRAWNAHVQDRSVKYLRWRTEGDAPQKFPEAIERPEQANHQEEE